jgi:hypothetical protein
VACLDAQASCRQLYPGVNNSSNHLNKSSSRTHRHLTLPLPLHHQCHTMPRLHLSRPRISISTSSQDTSISKPRRTAMVQRVTVSITRQLMPVVSECLLCLGSYPVHTHSRHRRLQCSRRCKCKVNSKVNRLCKFKLKVFNSRREQMQQPLRQVSRLCEQWIARCSHNSRISSVAQPLSHAKLGKRILSAAGRCHCTARDFRLRLVMKYDVMRLCNH